MDGNWYSGSAESSFRALGSSPSGLSEAQAQLALQKGGYNELVAEKKDPWYKLYISQFNSLPIAMLLAAAAISAALGFLVNPEKLIDAGAISVAMLIATSFGFWQEFKAEKALEALKKMVVLRSVVVRGGQDTTIDSRELVPGDVVILEEGSRVPADIRLIEAVNLACDQSMLTGESHHSDKSVCSLPAKTPLSERKNMVFAGTIVVRGHCRGLVVETGMRTEFGRIVGIVIKEPEHETRLQADISDLSKNLGYAGLILATAFFAIGLLRGEALVEMFIVAVTLAVAVIPEGLPTVLAITLAIGVQKMAKKNAIVRRISAVENLGSATVICTDKTGTITQNRMTVEELVLPEKAYGISVGRLDPSALRHDPCLLRAVEVMALCNNSLYVYDSGKESISGDHTEVALLRAATACGADERKMRAEHRVVGEIPFDSGRKMMTSVRLFGNRRMALVKGAPEQIIPRCTRLLLPSGEQQLTPAWRKKIASDARSLGETGMRVLALAYRHVPASGKYTSQNTECSLVYVGLSGMEDLPHPEVQQAISLCRTAGIRVIMVTGDSLATAKAVALKVGLMAEGQRAIDGSELEGLSDAEFSRVLSETPVFARVTPEQKYRIVSALMDSGEVVAVTGDGVNDAPAIKRADIGVAMGVAGTDVAKEVADIVLTDDNFTSIVNAVRYGRTIFNNIKSFVRYQISTNVAAITLMFAAPALSLPLPLNPIQILWINIMMDGPPALALGAEHPAHDIMRRPPRSPTASFITRNLVLSILSTGIIMAAISLSVFAFYTHYSPLKAGTVVFTLFVFLQLFHALNCRSGQESLFSRLFSNPAIYLAIALSLAVHMAIVYFAPLQSVFKTVPLEPGDLLTILAAASLIIIIEELKKKFLKQLTVY